MERHIVLSDLKQKGVVPPSWAAKFPSQATLLRRLMSPSPSDRPSAIEVLQHELPPRLEDEWLNGICKVLNIVLYRCTNQLLVRICGKIPYRAVRTDPPADRYTDRPLLGGTVEIGHGVQFQLSIEREIRKRRRRGETYLHQFPALSVTCRDSFSPCGEKDQGDVASFLFV
ncbi:hypothetical protein B296_00041668 [Ensete ventricosum]|uniref:Uncharacterized protein n=1 Tax=Ensete ventricosum TaxID=4639 RepID=A0A426XT95_ENSVE|nr:hypothetical protein B296_00041668 [Ensete ventricosum]